MQDSTFTPAGSPSPATSSSFSATAEEVQRVLSLAGINNPKSCLWIGRNDAVTHQLEPLLREGCELLVVGNSVGEITQGFPQSSVVDGPLLSADMVPPLGAVLDYAVTRPDPGQTISYYGALKNSSRNEKRQPALDRIRDDLQITRFDLAVVLGEQMLTDAIVSRIIGSSAILIDGAKTSYGGSAAFSRLFSEPDFVLAASNDLEAGGWALFVKREISRSNLPIHFFTIVLNGEPFIRYHEQMLLDLECPWHWHVIEGVASLVKDTSWSVAAGGHIPPEVHDRGKSNDGTTAYLDELQARYPNKVTIYRKPDDMFWDGKQEMVDAPIPNIKEPCLLWQIDADELWTAEQVHTVRQKFIDNPERSAAYFWCNYFVGSEKGISTRYNYAQNPNQEWLRVWRFEPGMKWDKHEPPVLAGYRDDGSSYDVGQQAPFLHHEMELCGAVFDHFAYTTPEQARFKESYYGYTNAVEQWRKLQDHQGGSGHLRDYFAWVTDETMFDDIARLEWAPIAFIDEQSGNWRFRSAAQVATLRKQRGARSKPRFVIDGVFYQLSSSGIARVWTSLLQEWVRTGYADNIVLVDRAGTAPRIDGVIYHSIPRHSWDTVDGDARLLQEVCDLEAADLFVSTYYTTPLRTPSVFFGHDMIPEIMGFNLDDLWWRQKRRAIQYAAGHIMVSQSSANDMCRFHPEIDLKRVLVAHNSVAPIFRPCSEEEIQRFRKEHGIDRDFIMMVGERFGWHGYKNGGVVFAALAQMKPGERPLLVCVGGQPELEEAGRAFLGPEDVKLLKLDDEGLRACYGAALAFVCPSSLEGFGLPVAEAMAVGCPALVCRNSSIPEVAGEAGIYFDQSDPLDLVRAIRQIKDRGFRQEVIAAGKAQAASFSQERSAQLIADYFEKVVAGLRDGSIRDHAGCLEDAFTDAEKRRSAEAERGALQATMDELKRRLGSSVRISPTDRSEAAKPAAPAASEKSADTGLLIAMERRLANAYAKLRTYEQAEGGEVRQEAQSTPVLDILDVAQVPQAPEDQFATLVRTYGLTGIEGPYPDQGITRSFRWQVEPSSRYTFAVPMEGPAIFELDFSNVEADQHIRVLVEDRLLGEVTPAEYGWNHVWHIALPTDLAAGEHRFTVEASASGTIDSDRFARHIAIHGVSLRLLH